MALHLKESVFLFSLFITLLAFMPYVVEFCVSKTYPTHRGGVVLVTGSSTGLGYDASLRLVEEGYTVYAGVRKGEDLARLENLDIERLIPIRLDVTSAEDIDSAYDRVSSDLEKSGQPFAALVNNAGYATVVPVEFDSIQSIRDVFETNVFGAIALTQKFLPLIRKDSGRILMISSLFGVVATPLWGTLAASKHAMEAYTQALRRELVPYGVSVTSIQPGVVATAALGKVNKSVGAGIKEVYGHLYTPAKEEEMKRNVALASSTAPIVDAYVQAIASPHPRTVYAVGNVGGVPAGIMASLLWLLPDRVKDALLS